MFPFHFSGLLLLLLLLLLLHFILVKKLILSSESSELLPIDMTYEHPRRLASATTPLSEPQKVHILAALSTGGTYFELLDTVVALRNGSTSESRYFYLSFNKTVNFLGSGPHIQVHGTKFSHCHHIFVIFNLQTIFRIKYANLKHVSVLILTCLHINIINY
jgi:hypothetical protein